MQEKYARIVVDITSEDLDRTFEYRIPQQLWQQVGAGSVEEVPFGRANRVLRGYVISVSERAQFAPEKIKDIQRVITDGLDEEARLVSLAAKIRTRYGSTMAQALRTVFPIRRRVKSRQQQYLKRKISAQEAQDKLALYQKKHQTARARLMEALMEDPVLPLELVWEKLKAGPAVVRALEEQGVVEIVRESAWRNPTVSSLPSLEKGKLNLTSRQQEITRSICREMDLLWEGRQISGRYLIHGVTGSGKTAVYMELIAHAQQQGKTAIMLIPEISLTWQTVMRFRRRFGERVSFIHSRISEGERFDQYERARRGEIDIMIGPRSALFVPFSNLGIIVIDEEQEGAYQSESVPRYHAREVARMRAGMEHAALVLGSATPSLSAYYEARQGEYTLLELPERINGEGLPRARIVDMREELAHGNRSILSRMLQEEIRIRLDRHEQVMLFLNRRGYAGFISCRSCGHVIKCPHCDVSLSLHRNGRMVCHYCGYSQPQITKCPVCGSGFLRSFRAGTQQIEEETARLFPDAGILRMDLDTTSKKDAYDRLLSSFAGHEADILIGTQMIVKGHDFPDVTLVGILAADLSLHVPDYRAGERTFQLITQAAGRAGRARLPGEVIVQTYSPGHYAIVCAASQDYHRFYEEEMSYRLIGGYPPAGHLIAVHLSCADEKQLEMAAEYLGKYARLVLQRLTGKRPEANKEAVTDASAETGRTEKAETGNPETGESVEQEEGTVVLGPADEAVSKIQDQFRKVLYLKGPDRELLERIREHLDAYIAVNSGYRTVTVIYE